MKHGHKALTSSMDIQHGHEARHGGGLKVNRSTELGGHLLCFALFHFCFTSEIRFLGRQIKQLFLLFFKAERILLSFPYFCFNQKQNGAL
jgi:hypothetical protein